MHSIFYYLHILVIYKLKLYTMNSIMIVILMLTHASLPHLEESVKFVMRLELKYILVTKCNQIQTNHLLFWGMLGRLFNLQVFSIRI